MQTEKTTSANEQYTLWQIFLIWLGAGAPMWLLGWVAYPALSKGLSITDAGLMRLRLLTIGLIWQFVLSMIILYREEGNIRLETIRRRFWLNNPISPKTGEKFKKLWWWIIPLILLTVAAEFLLSGPLNDLWVSVFPFLAEPPGFAADALFETPEKWIGAWNLLALFTVLAVFNTFLGEEFIFRGVLLPKMEGVFGKWDWVANGVIFGVYHLHQPWGLPGGILVGLIFAFSGKHFRTNWFPIILHSGQSVFIFVLILGLVLGLA
ncbi:MAG TPA: CPBP family intramembrane glutamic endopeptidase [Anaerolineales bacterium]|nr:CPBP family intramembrane glutamic endopeptidase [Anaerolineales bacterium]